MCPQKATDLTTSESKGRGSKPVRPVAVLDANVLIPPGLRDLLLSCAHVGLFRPIWQQEIEAEVHRNGIRLDRKRGASDKEAAAQLDHVFTQMNRAFPDARLGESTWLEHVKDMTNDPKDRHVLAVAVGGGATHVVTSNTKHFPLRSRPPRLVVQRPDAFLLERLAERPEEVITAVRQMAARHQRPPETAEALALKMTKGSFVQRFGEALLALLVHEQGD
ncbi:MAG TPA: PIN domain-containing protein [Acidimicrobiales bacterium]|nr:PIN domain-containing protein [Acidimicrobiales bacterium]